MMSITNKSRVLAFVLAVAMILSLVPVMAAANGGKDSMDYAKITYPASNDATKSYKIKTTFYGADGAKANGDLAVRIYNQNDPFFYYNVMNVTNGAVEFTVSLAGKPEGRYDIEFITANMGNKNKAYFHFYNDVDKAIDELNKEVKAATSFDSLEVQQKLANLDGTVVYDKYIVNKEDEDMSAQYISDVADNIKALNPLYTSDAAFAKAVEEATVISLFDEITIARKGYFDNLLLDDDVLNVIANSGKSSKFVNAKRMLDAIAPNDKNVKVGFIATNLSNTAGIYGSFATMANVGDKLAAAIIATLNKPEVGGAGGIKDNVSNNDSVVVPVQPSNPVISVSNVFTDLDSNLWWLIEPLQALYTKGYINGRTSTTFAPNENITRAEFLKILLLELNMVDANATVAFSDVNTSDWFYPYVASGANKGIVKGRSETEFAPNALITREEICVMTMRAVRAAYINLGTTVVTGAFTDEADIASYAVSDVHALKAAGIVSGRNTGAFDPKANATRAEAVKILYGVYVKQ